MAAAKLLIDRVIPSRRGAPVSFHIRPLKTLDCALAYADLLDDVGSGRLTPDEARPSRPLLRSARSCSPWSSWAAEIDTLKAQLGAVVGTPPPSTGRRPVAIA